MHKLALVGATPPQHTNTLTHSSNITIGESQFINHVDSLVPDEFGYVTEAVVKHGWE